MVLSHVSEKRILKIPDVMADTLCSSSASSLMRIKCAFLFRITRFGNNMTMTQLAVVIQSGNSPQSLPESLIRDASAWTDVDDSSKKTVLLSLGTILMRLLWLDLVSRLTRCCMLSPVFGSQVLKQTCSLGDSVQEYYVVLLRLVMCKLLSLIKKHVEGRLTFTSFLTRKIYESLHRPTPFFSYRYTLTSYFAIFIWSSNICWL